MEREPEMRRRKIFMNERLRQSRKRVGGGGTTYRAVQ